MKRCTILVALLCVFLWSVHGLWARPRPERIGLPPVMTPASSWDDPYSNDDSLHIYDTRHYELRVDFDLTNQLIYGDATIHCISTDNTLDEILLELKSLTIDTVQVDGVISAYDYHSDSLFVPLPAPLLEGDSVTVRVVYHGHPYHESWGGFYFNWNVAFNLGDGLNANPPPINHVWFPNWRHPADKFTMEMWFTVPDDKVAGSNGELIEVIENIPEQTVTWHWQQHEPVSSYLFCVAISNYIILENPVYDWIQNFVYPGDSAQAVESYSNLDEMMDCYQYRFSPYPYTGKFGYAQVSTGDMEHVGLVAHRENAVNGGHGNDWLLAHEMSHMWWGNLITCGTWKDLWLNEGQGTYCEALYFECANGAQGYRNYMQSSLMGPYLGSGQLFPIYDPISMWSYTVYEKGGCVMHMLRGVSGDSLSFGGWNDYGDQYRFDTATTDDFQTVMEDYSGQDLDWFFDQWIYGPGYPRYNYAWEAVPNGNQWDIHLWVDQVQSSGGPFTMPIDFAAISGEDTVVTTVWIDSDPDTAIFPGGSNQPTSLIFDYHNWVLERHTEVPSAVLEDTHVPLTYSLQPAFPNPFNASTVISYSVPVLCHTELAVYNILGQQVATLVYGDVEAGTHTVAWDGRDMSVVPAASGVYLVSMTAPGFQQVQKVIMLR